MVSVQLLNARMVMQVSHAQAKNTKENSGLISSLMTLPQIVENVH
jgi:hypothetical protein